MSCCQGHIHTLMRNFVCCDDDDGDDDNVQNILLLSLSWKSSLKSEKKKGPRRVLACLPYGLILFLFPQERKDRFLSSLATHSK